MDLRVNETNDIERNTECVGGEPANVRLSDLDESRAFGEHWTCTRALNATLFLSRSDGKSEEFTDLSSSYGAVNFAECLRTMLSSVAR